MTVIPNKIHFIAGGSLMVQMFGSSPTQKCVEAEDDANQKFGQIIKNGLSTSPVVVRSRKDVRDIL